jgi:CHAT domain-containing protein/TPR repeat protein
VKRINLILLNIITLFCANYIIAQNLGTYDLFLKFAELYNSGDLVDAEKCMESVLESGYPISQEYLVAAYNNLGATNTLLGKYKEALEYYNLAENQITKNQKYSKSLADIYINKAIIYGFQSSNTLAIEYFEKGIRICQGIANPDRNVFHSISTAYLDIGILYYEIKDYEKALEYLEKSAELKSRYRLSKIALPYLNIAKTYVKTGDPQKAEEFFLRSMDNISSEFGEDYFRIAELFFDYGLFLESGGRYSEALEIFKKALTICKKNYGDKNPLVSLSYKHLGDYFINRVDYNSALLYYQEALIAIVNDFNDPDIFSNPSINSSLYDIRLLDVLKSKSLAFKLSSLEQLDLETKVKNMKESLETIELAMQLINRIRRDYLTDESRIYLAENEKETYIHATNISHYLYTLTGDPMYRQKMYQITVQAKAAILRNEIADNEMFFTIGIPDSLKDMHNKYLVDIAAYNKLVLEELRKAYPDNRKIDFWKDALFEMKLESGKLEDEINIQFPHYRELIQQTEPISLEEIQSNLGKNETLVEYFISNHYTDGKRDLFIFLVTRDKLNFLESDLDSLFLKDVNMIREGTVQVQSLGDPLFRYRAYTNALFNMYNRLIKPVEHLFAGNKLIIIPDEEIAYLPFDAFLKSYPDSTRINYEGLQYLIYQYTISYGYSSSLIFNKEKHLIKGSKVYAFSPYYRNSIDNTGKRIDTLAGAAGEIASIYRRFHGREYLGEQATETNFKSVIQQPFILHMAMHSMADPDNSRYSFFMFDTKTDTVEDGKLYNYEIGINRIKSPMVVLSACNTGTGTLSHGEGIMSLARGFFLAGALSVVKTFWDVNDETSAAIISCFYYYLSKGEKKDEALRLAKLEYLKTHPPVYTNPYYWAAYEVLGDNNPIVRKNLISVLLISVIMILLTGALIYYFRRRNILSALS